MFAVRGELLNPPPRHVPDEIFEEALGDNDVLGVARSVLSRFPNISREGKKRSLHRGLWKTLRGHNFAQGQKFTTSLYESVKRACIDEFQAEQKEKRQIERFTPSGDYLDGVLAPEESFFSTMEKERACRALSLLNEPTRKVLLARYGEKGQSVEELALRWRLTVENTRERLRRALEQFRRKYYSLEKGGDCPAHSEC